MDKPVDPKLVDALLKYFPDFRKAYEPDGLRPEEFVDFLPTKRTLSQFLGGYASLLETIRGFMIKL